jgi:hypothetical protein
MRNVDDHRAAGGPAPEGAGVYAPGPARRARRRRQAAIGAVGLLAILGVGGIVATQVLDDPDTTAITGAGAPLPVASGTGAPSAVTGSTQPGSAAASTATTGAAKGAPTATPKPLTTEEQIAAVRSAAAKPNNQVRPGLPPNAAADTVNPADVTTATTQQGGEDLKTVSARQDLTGYQELSLIADQGTRYGDSRCTSKIRVSPKDKPRERPTLLLCWRTSAEKSVFTVAVKRDGRPSSKLSLAAIDKRWAELG